jgi:murein DD-endopeptidase MepM/ murein hydrolase activator NlpD
VAHVAVVALLAFSVASGLSALRANDATPGGVSFDIVSTARGAAAESTYNRSVSFSFAAGDPASADPLVSRNAIPTPTPLVTPSSTPKPAASSTPAPQPVVAVSTRVVAVAGNGKLMWPVANPTITTYFSASHLAIDLAVPAGSPVVAAAAGTVISAGWRNNGGGIVIEIDHGNGMHTLYNHLGSMLVGVGAVVGRGQLIARVGCTGMCTGPHVHFQVMVGGVFVNPLRYL